MVPQEYREEEASSQASRNSMVAVKDSLLPLYDDCNIQAVGAPGGVLPYVTLTGTCGPIGYSFQGVLS